jgi:hypothetical protein
VKVLTLLFFAAATYLLGAIASALAAGQAVAGGSSDLTYALIPLASGGGSILFTAAAVTLFVFDNARARNKALAPRV